MKRLAFFCLICLTALSACSKEGSSITSITGEIIDIEKGNLKIMCSNYVTKQKNSSGSDDIGYTCVVKITDETLIKSDNGEKITLSDLQQNNVVSVILTEEKTLTEDRDSRTIEAKELTLLEK
ncbi:hypothetical protein MKZ25_08370 [Solibacillus sp. FSL W7-1464]|uniref:hypothetical protein n=1 Tax=Solibacillus sp. FSL W7-1464 TaxID=2921706 RepID=UPI0030F66CEB